MSKEEQFFLYLINKLFYNGVINSTQQQEMVTQLYSLYGKENDNE